MGIGNHIIGIGNHIIGIGNHINANAIKHLNYE